LPLQKVKAVCCAFGRTMAKIIIVSLNH